MEQACMLCHRSDADPDICGPIADYQGICAHLFCLLFANDVHPEWSEQGQSVQFLPAYIRHTVEQAAQRVCFVCGESGATITCQETGCDRRFHLPCAMEGRCITHYIPPHRSYCWEHCPQQQEEVAPENTTCIICLSPVEGRTTYGTMMCPVCKRAWFHRACIQRQALSAGIFSLQCPLCRNRNIFLLEMLFMGIRIPVRQASWETNSAYAELYQRHSSCSARECLCPGGREEAEAEGAQSQLRACWSQLQHPSSIGADRGCSSTGAHQTEH
ncbi:PHD finger protein 7-like [Lathamus discolor]|uniref:PHD finger protein 7-like n=1 Tax=Lathamus discolor TaxID=678569 RepID=UPI0032B76694